MVIYCRISNETNVAIVRLVRSDKVVQMKRLEQKIGMIIVT